MNRYFYLICRKNDTSFLIKEILKKQQNYYEIKVTNSLESMLEVLASGINYPQKIFIDEQILINRQNIQLIESSFPLSKLTILASINNPKLEELHNLSIHIKETITEQIPNEKIQILDGIISLKSGTQIILLHVKDMLLIERRKNATYIHCQNGKSYSVKISLAELEKKLSSYFFFRTHQSYLIPLNKINRIELDEFVASYIVEINGTNERAILSKHKYREIKDILLLNTI